MGVSGGPDIIQNGLVYAVDASDKNSYPGSGTTLTDLTLSGNTGTLTNGVAYNSSGFFNFDGSDDYIELNSPSSLPVGTSNRTITAMVRTPSSYPQSLLHVMHYGTPVQDQAFGLALYISGYLATHPWVGSPYAPSPALSTSTYYGLAVGYQHSNTTHYFWINGESKAGTNNVRSINTGTSTARIGARISTPTELWGPDGYIYSVYVYNRLLTDQEVAQNYNAQKSRLGLK